MDTLQPIGKSSAPLAEIKRTAELIARARRCLIEQPCALLSVSLDVLGVQPGDRPDASLIGAPPGRLRHSICHFGPEKELRRWSDVAEALFDLRLIAPRLNHRR
jgi:hypothetical protein